MNNFSNHPDGGPSGVSVRLSRVHYPVTALGPGTRAGVWFQGCTLGCPGCVSRDTWDPAAGTQTTVDDILNWITATVDKNTAGITISGGEPSEQPNALTALIVGLTDLRVHLDADWDVLCYTGLESDEFLKQVPAAHDSIDALIIGRFHISEPTTLIWRGSANQRIVPLSVRGADRYAEFMDQSTDSPPIQFSVQGGQVWLVGIPRRSDLNHLQRHLRKAGIELEDVSWRP